MTYEEHKIVFLRSELIPNDAKQALLLLDELDCTDALNYARTFFAMMEKKYAENQADTTDTFRYCSEF
tara:strand:+ start:236 stop:439 length:204 start_codon:yes stop_codon:yes gene_type:complete